MIYPLSLYLTRSYEVQPEASSAENLRRPLLGLLIAASRHFSLLLLCS